MDKVNLIYSIYSKDKSHTEEDLKTKYNDLHNLLGSSYLTTIEFLFSTPNNASPYKMISIILEYQNESMLHDLSTGLDCFQEDKKNDLKNAVIKILYQDGDSIVSILEEETAEIENFSTYNS